MTKKLAAVLLTLSLVGAGCPFSPEPDVPAYIPGETPTATQLEIMTDAEKIAGMEAMMEEHPPNEMNREEQVGEVNRSIVAMRDGITIRHGEFEGRFLHPAEGSVRVIKEDGKYVLVFSNDFSVLPGPALYVYLSADANPQNAGAVMEEGFEIGKLKATSGVQTYELPGGINWGNEGATSSRAAIHSIVVVCKPFKFIFASAGF